VFERGFGLGDEGLRIYVSSRKRRESEEQGEELKLVYVSAGKKIEPLEQVSRGVKRLLRVRAGQDRCEAARPVFEKNSVRKNRLFDGVRERPILRNRWRKIVVHYE
jgi:hypothetical protein